MSTPESTPTPAAERKVIKDVIPAKPSSSLRGSFTKHQNYYEEHDAQIDFRTGMSGLTGLWVQLLTPTRLRMMEWSQWAIMLVLALQY